MGKRLSVVVVTKFLLFATLFYNQLPHCSAQDYSVKRSEQSDELKNMIRVIKRSSNNDEEYPEEMSNGNDLINFPWVSNEDAPEPSRPWWHQPLPSEEKRGAGNMIRMIKRNMNERKNNGIRGNTVDQSGNPYAAWKPDYVWNHSLFWKRGNQYAAKRKKEANIFRLIK